MTGSTHTWGSAVWESQSAICQSYDAFMEEMLKVFEHPVRSKDATKRLLSLWQDSCSVAELAIDFWTLAAVNRWNDEAPQGAFQNALNEIIKDELVSHDEPKILDNLLFLAIRINNHLRERCRGRAVKQLTSTITSVCPRHSPPMHHQHPQALLSGSESEPMQLGRANLTRKEREFQVLPLLRPNSPTHFLLSHTHSRLQDGGKIVSWSTYCHTNCLHSALNPAISEPQSLPEPPDPRRSTMTSLQCSVSIMLCLCHLTAPIIMP